MLTGNQSEQLDLYYKFMNSITNKNRRVYTLSSERLLRPLLQLLTFANWVKTQVSYTTYDDCKYNLICLRLLING